MRLKRRILFMCFLTAAPIGFVEIASAAPATSRAQFCAARTQPSYFNDLAYDPKNQMAFRNKGGLMNKGVCWWHALYQRAAFYLTVYRPELPRPTRDHVKSIVHQIAAGKQIVEIPGYSNFHDFSRDWEPVIQDKIEEWQLVDGFLKFAWIEGLQGKNVVPPADLAKEMDYIYQSTTQEHDIQWIMLQIPGVSSHGILSVEVVRHPGGAQMEIVDNNFIGHIKVLLYQKGADTLKSMYYGSVAPYLGRKKDLKSFKKAAETYCSRGPQQMDDQSELDNGIE